LDCLNLNAAISAIESVVTNGATASYNMFMTAGGHSGIVIGGSVFWTVYPPRPKLKPKSPIRKVTL